MQYTLSDDAAELLTDIVLKSGGREKWDRLTTSARRICRSRDQNVIWSWIKGVGRSEGGSIQLAMIALLGLTIVSEILRQSEMRHDS